MSQDYKFKFDRMRENDPSAPEDNPGKTEHYPAPGHVRNLAFGWPDGRKLFLNYSYMVSGEYKPDEKIIELEFTTHIVKLKGYKLEILFDALMNQEPRVIRCIDKRYNTLNDENTPVVNEMSVTKNTG